MIPVLPPRGWFTYCVAHEGVPRPLTRAFSPVRRHFPVAFVRERAARHNGSGRYLVLLPVAYESVVNAVAQLALLHNVGSPFGWLDHLLDHAPLPALRLMQAAGGTAFADYAFAVGTEPRRKRRARNPRA